MDFWKYITRVFNDSRFFPKAGVIWGIFFINSIISLVLNGLVTVTDYFPKGMFGDSLVFIPMLSSLGLPLIASFVTIPLWLYTKGYLFEITNAIRTGTTGDVLPEHGNIKSRLNFGGIYFTLQFSLVIPFIVLLSIPIMVLIYAMATPEISGNQTLVIALVAGFITIMILTGIAMFLINTILVPSMMYVYLKRRSFSDMFSFGQIKDVIRTSWWMWLVLALIMFTVNMVAGMISFVLCCLSILVAPTIQTVTFLVSSAMIGSIYYNLDRQNVISERE